jgi:hypothetical protein
VPRGARTVLSRHNLHRTYQGAVAKLADPAVPLRPTARRVLRALRDGGPQHTDQLYERIQLPHRWLAELQVALEAEIAARQGQAAHELQQLDRELLGLKGERRKLLEAYYADAIDLTLLRQEQTRISQRTTMLDARRRSLTANLDDWRAILETAGRFATNCAAAYRHADPPTRKLFNNAVIDRIEIRDGHIAQVDYKAPFDLLFGWSGFECRTVVELRGFEPLTPCMPLTSQPIKPQRISTRCPTRLLLSTQIRTAASSGSSCPARLRRGRGAHPAHEVLGYRPVASAVVCVWIGWRLPDRSSHCLR